MKTYTEEQLSKMTNNELKSIADSSVRHFLLYPFSKCTTIFCPIKEKRYPKKNMDVAHFIDRAIMNTRYDLDNVYLISRDSNQFDARTPDPTGKYKSLHHKEYADFLGEKKVKELLEKSKELRIFAKEDFINIIKTYGGTTTSV